MKIPHAREWQNAALDLPFACGNDRVPQQCHVLEPRQLKLFNDSHAFDFVFPSCQVVQFEPPEIPVASGVHRFAKLIDGQFEELVVVSIEG